MEAQAPIPGCARHQGLEFVYLCTDCDEKLLCVRCVVETHHGHKFVIIDDVMSEKKAEIQKYIDKMSNTDNPSLLGEISTTEDKIKENGKTFKQLIVNIKNQAQKMKSEIDKCAEKLIQICCEIEKNNEEILKSYKSVLESLKITNERRIQDFQQTLESGIKIEVFKKAKETRSILSSLPVPGKIQTVQFCVRPVSASLLEHSLGYITVDGQDQRYCPKTKVALVSEFTHKSFVSTCLTTQDTAWLSYWRDEEIHKVDQKGYVRETIQCKIKVTNITISPTTGRIWFCCTDDRTVREVIDSNTFVTRFVTEDKPGALCITTNNTVVVGMRGKIVMYTTDGREVESAGAGGPCRAEAVSPFHMAHCPQTGDIGVVDSRGANYADYVAGREPGKQSHFKMMDKHLNVRFMYPCQSTPDVGTHKRSPRQQSLFYPYDVCFDSAGNVLVADAVSKSVVLIDRYRGDYIQTIYTDDIEPQSISLQTDGTLWVGHSIKTLKVLKFK